MRNYKEDATANAAAAAAAHRLTTFVAARLWIPTVLMIGVGL